MAPIYLNINAFYEKLKAQKCIKLIKKPQNTLDEDKNYTNSGNSLIFFKKMGGGGCYISTIYGTLEPGRKNPSIIVSFLRSTK